jgi:hypothetical protein
MNYIKNILFLLFFFVIAKTYAVEPSGEDKSLLQGVAELVNETKEMNSYGAGMGANFALPAVATIVVGIQHATTYVAAKATVAYVAAQGAAIAAAPVAVPCAGVAVVSYVGYKAYRYFSPTFEQQAKDAENKVRTAEANAKNAKAQEEIMLLKFRSELQNCLMGNRLAPRNNSGIPMACEKDVLNLAVSEGKSVEQISASFLKFASPPHKK